MLVRPRRHLTVMSAFAILIGACGGASPTGGGQSVTGGQFVTAANGSLKGEQFTFVTSVGARATAFRHAWLTPFETLTGATVTLDGPESDAKLQAQVASGNIIDDVAETTTSFVAANCGTLFVDISKAVDRTHLYPNLVTNPCGVAAAQTAVIFVYNKATFSANPPSSWADFFNTKTYPGKRGVLNNGVFNRAFEAALLADGISPSQLYPLDLNRATAKLKIIKGSLVFAPTLTALQDMVVGGAVAMALIFNTYAFQAVQAGANYAAVWTQNLQTSGNFAILKGTAHLKAAEAFLSYFATPAVQYRITQEPYLFYPLTQGTQSANTDPIAASYSPLSHLNDGIAYNSWWWSTANQASAAQAWAQFTAG